jgi:hypothetical protein
MHYKSTLVISDKNRINSLDSKLNFTMKPMQLMLYLYHDYNRNKPYKPINNDGKYQ